VQEKIMTFNEYIKYQISPKMPKRIKPENWKNHYLSTKTHFSIKCLIHFGTDSNEDNIIPILNHEYLHCFLYVYGEVEACHKLDFLWYKYEQDYKIPKSTKQLLQGLVYSGIGFPIDD
jgi:hypothetical protein